MSRLEERREPEAPRGPRPALVRQALTLERLAGLLALPLIEHAPLTAEN